MEEAKVYQSFKTHSAPKDKKKFYEDATRRIAEVEGQIGGLPFAVADQVQKDPTEDGEGAVYAGFRNEAGEKWGFGIKLWSDGGLYVGNWRGNKANGKGWFFLAEGDVYKGDWIDDKMNGQGTYLHVSGSKYVGHWYNDLKSGYGEERWGDDSSYEGVYLDGKKHGKGCYKWPDGSSYDGMWHHNQI